MISSMPKYFQDDQYDRLAREIIRENAGGKDPELALIGDFIDEIDQRLEQVKVYLPVMELFRKRKTIDEPACLIPELSFLLLSFLIYEGKLKHRGITFEEIRAFLGGAVARLSEKEYDQETVDGLAMEILDQLQNGGRNFILNVYSLKTGTLREKYVKFIEIRQSEDGVLQYHITEQGVDFYLKTKEFPEETKITVNLLLFQKQMEKGAFGFAYETVRRLNMEVQKKKDRKYSLLESLLYGRTDSGEAYNSYHRSIVMQFEEEAELFNAAMRNVRNAFGEYVERINSGEATEKETRTFMLLKIIENEIGRAQTLHTELLKEAAGFTGEYDRVLTARRKAIFTERFSFQAEFEKLASQNKNPGAMKYLFEPLMRPNIRKSFNILRAFEPQKATRSKTETDAGTAGEENSERLTLDQETSARVGRNFVFYAQALLKALAASSNRMGLKDFCSLLAEKYSEDALYNGDFISFILEMNREKPMGERARTIRFSTVDPKQELKTIEEVFFRAALNVKLDGRINQVTVKSFPDEDLELLPGLRITNMMFTGERI